MDTKGQFLGTAGLNPTNFYVHKWICALVESTLMSVETFWWQYWQIQGLI